MRLSILLPLGALSGICFAAACGSPTDSSGGLSGGSSGFAAGGSAAGGGGGSLGGLGGSLSTGGNGGSLNVDGGSSGGNGGSGGFDPDAACTGVTQTATAHKQGADIIFIVDNSCSMTDEAVFVQERMNSFSTGIVASGIDMHVVLISSYPNQGNGMCIDPPLGSGGCPTADSQPPTFFHQNTEVDSHNGLQDFLNTYPQWSQYMRPDALKHVVIITDDESYQDPNTWYNQVLALDPSWTGFKFDGVFSWSNPSGGLFGLCNGNPDPCCSLSAAKGTKYASLVAKTNGVSGNLCTQAPGFTAVFNAVSASVITSAGLACEWTIPPPTGSDPLDPGRVNVKYNDGTKDQDLGYVGDQGLSECATFGGGWYYDNPTNPTKVYACPQTCDVIKVATNGSINIQLGCATKPAEPPH